MMSMHEMGLEGLAVFEGGRVSAAFDRLLQRAVDDCLDRPGEPKARVVTVQVEIVPVCEQDGSCTKTDTQVKLASKVPDYRTQVVSCALRRIRGKDGRGERGQLVFNEDSPDDVDQSTLLPD